MRMGKDCDAPAPSRTRDFSTLDLKPPDIGHDFREFRRADTHGIQQSLIDVHQVSQLLQGASFELLATLPRDEVDGLEDCVDCQCSPRGY